ncbi:leucine-rich PPR motif-containing protein, mitochondrial [Procambarus clarkii]|uniref:leucine-rich PPR motif-containing protein, mitochondrial n=1 Tax=Procambarus clarkii TaxID=6728 RepID=UPI0037423CCE
MAALLRSRSFHRIFSGFRQSWTSNVPRCEALTLQRLQTTPLHSSVTRLLSAQRPVENVRSGQVHTVGIDKALFRIDTEIRRTGRIFKKDIEEIFREIKALKYASSNQSLLLLRCCGSLVPEELPEVRNKLLQEIWDTLLELRIPLDVSHYNTLLRVYLENEHKFSPTEFLADLEKKGIEPNRVTYQRLIARYCQDGDIDGATKILEFMKEKQLPVGENIFNTLIMGHARANDMESAHKVLDVMKGSGLEPSTDTYTMLLVSYAEHGNIEGLQSALAECELAELHLHDRELMEIILALAIKGHQQHVPMIIEKLQKVAGYQQDVMNLVYRLLNAGCHEVAYKMFSTMKSPQNAEGESNPVGFFFIKHIVKCGLPTSIAVQYCQEIKKNGQNMFALETALGAALSNGLPEAAMFILRVMNEDGVQLRTHYFWPIILHYAKHGKIEKLYDTVKEMVTFEVPLTFETFKHYVIPAALCHQDLDSVIRALKDAGMPFAAIISGCVAYLLEKKDIAAAANLVSRYRFRLTPALRRDLVDAYIEVGDSMATAIVLGYMLQYNQETVGEAKETEVEALQQDIAGLFILDVIQSSHRSSLDNRIKPLLQEMASRNMNISKDNAVLIKSKLEQRMNEEVLKLLDSLSSEDLTFQPPPREFVGSRPFQNVEELERRLVELETNNLPTGNILSQLLFTHIRTRDTKKAEEVKKKLDAEDFPFGTGLYVLLIDMYVNEGLLPEAIAVLQELEQREPESKLKPFKCLRLAHLMVQHDKVEDALKLIENHAQEGYDDSKELAVLANLSKRFLDVLADKGDVATVQRFLETLLRNKVVQPGSVVFGTLIRAHLANDDLDGALKEFENICREHRVTPYKIELTKRCISLEDADKLQKIMDLSIEIHGDLNSLYDMVFAFIECGRIKQAKKLLETPGLRAFNIKLDNQCKRYLENNRIEELEHLVNSTRDVFDLDRHMMYMHLLTAYRQQNDCEKALGLWTSMQEENIQPTETFLIKLGEFLKNNGREVPFIIPELKSEASEETPTVDNSLITRNFTPAVNAKNQIELSGKQSTISDRSKLIERLLQDGQLGEASRMTRDMLISGTHPIARVLKFLMIQLAKAGDVETITFCTKYLSDDLKRRIKISNSLCAAYRNSGRSEEVLENLQTKLQEATDIDLPRLDEEFPRGGVIGILEESPQLLPKVMSLADEYASRGITGPANCVWMHLFSQGSYDEAQEFYGKHLSESSSRLMFRSILNCARRTKNADLPAKLLEFLNGQPNVHSTSKGLVYSAWIDILVDEGKIEEGLKVLQTSTDSMHLENINQTALIKLRDALTNSGKLFPYTIPQKVNRNRRDVKSSSSSSSDSD